jgi:hypothetical protein
VGHAGHVVHSGAFGEQNVDTLFFMLKWDRYGFDKKCHWTCYAELVFFNPVGYAGHVVHSGASRECNNDALFFTLGWAWCGFHKIRVRIRYIELVFLPCMGPLG